jgi:spore cortex protein
LKKIFMFAIAYMVIFLLMGCINNQNDDATNNGDNNESENIRFERNQEGNQKDVSNNNTNQTAYVAIVLRDAANKEVAKKIVDQVKTTDAGIQKVFVSADLDFADRITDYGEGINEGPPAEDLFKEEFNDVVQVLFPDAQ